MAAILTSELGILQNLKEHEVNFIWAKFSVSAYICKEVIRDVALKLRQKNWKLVKMAAILDFGIKSGHMTKQKF